MEPIQKRPNAVTRRWLAVAVAICAAQGSLSHAQSWTPPVGVPNPGSWFMATTGDVRDVTSGGGSITFSGSGTATAPVVYRGAGRAFTGQVSITGSYVIVEDIVVNGGVVRFSGDHLALRDSEIANNSGAISKTTVNTSGTSSDIVLFRNAIHDNGQWQSTSENDFHGVSASGSVRRMWILENEMYHHGGDSVQIGHNGGNSVSGVYIGRNVMHHDRENAVDLKEVSDVVVSENIMYGYRSTGSSEGAAVVIHYCPINASIVNNLIYDSQVGISSTSLNSACDGRSVTNRVVGNVIHTILASAIQGWGSGKVTQVANNTIHNVQGAGIDLTNAESGSFAENNILSGVRGQQIVGVTSRNNLTSGDPLFVNAAGGDFRLQSGSPAVNKGVASAAFSGFQSVFGVSIAIDRDGQSRPSGSAFDIGAYELPGGVASGVPSAPGNLTVQ